MKTLGSLTVFTLSISLCIAAKSAPGPTAAAPATGPTVDIAALEMALTVIERDVVVMEDSMKALKDEIQKNMEGQSQGQTYTRWGKKTCPSTAELVYSGFAGGSHYLHSGGAADYLCLTPTPKYGQTVAGRQNWGGIVYGAEYERTGGNTIWGDNKLNYNVPCAVCRTKKSSVLMIPGTNTCESGGWTREYYGYLSSGRWNHQSATEFVCVDMVPDLIGSKANEDGKLFYLVEGACGSLNCPPYVEGAELTCVVCSK